MKMNKCPFGKAENLVVILSLFWTFLFEEAFFRDEGYDFSQKTLKYI